jgi:hypothetical protein
MHRLNDNIKLNLKKNMMEGCGLDSFGAVQGSREHGNETSVSIRGEDFVIS